MITSKIIANKIIVYKDKNEDIHINDNGLLNTKEGQFLKLSVNDDKIILSVTDSICAGPLRDAYFASVNDECLLYHLKSALYFNQSAYLCFIQDSDGRYVSQAMHISTLKEEYPEVFQELGEAPFVDNTSPETIGMLEPMFVISNYNIDGQAEYRETEKLYLTAMDMVKGKISELSETLDKTQQAKLNSLLAAGYWLLEVSCYLEEIRGEGVGREIALEVMNDKLEKLGLRERIDKTILQ